MPPPDDAAKPAAEEIGFDAESVLARDSRVVLDPNFLAALHGELARELDAEQTATTLLQMGFLHGLQDVTRALALTAESRPYENMASLTLPLRMPCRSHERADAPGAVWVEGVWPDHHEALAYLSALGRGGRTEGVCYLSAGYTSGWLSGAFDADLVAVETSCSARGEHDCRFVAREAAEWSSRGDPRAARGLAALPFAALRALVRERCARDPERALPTETASAAAMDRDAAAVHIWGPVMVLPYAGPNETLEALELLARDPTASAVSVIVLDLGGAIVDEAFGALALEQLVQTAEGWGAEVIFVDPSPLSDRVIADLDHPPLLVEKGLEAAVALAFQIARSQKRSL
jgi:V4R domain-containing protein